MQPSLLLHTAAVRSPHFYFLTRMLNFWASLDARRTSYIPAFDGRKQTECGYFHVTGKVGGHRSASTCEAAEKSPEFNEFQDCNQPLLIVLIYY